MDTIITAGIAPAIEEGIDAANASAAAEGDLLPFPAPDQGAFNIQATREVFPYTAQTAAQQSEARQSADAILQTARAARRAIDPTFS
jgi:hypothetical protein